MKTLTTYQRFLLGDPDLRWWQVKELLTAGKAVLDGTNVSPRLMDTDPERAEVFELLARMQRVVIAAQEHRRLNGTEHTSMNLCVALGAVDDFPKFPKL